MISSLLWLMAAVAVVQLVVAVGELVALALLVRWGRL